MEKLILEIRNQIYETIVLCREFIQSYGVKTVGISLILIYLIFLRKWEFKKVLSFVFTVLMFFIVLVRVEALMTAKFGAESSDIAVSVGRLIFLVITAVVYIYHAALKT